jgi:hypothetical protein
MGKDSLQIQKKKRTKKKTMDSKIKNSGLSYIEQIGKMPSTKQKECYEKNQLNFFFPKMLFLHF